MSYSTSNPPALIAQGISRGTGAATRIWQYTDGDALSAVSAINYISNATDLGLKAGDRVIHDDTGNNAVTDMTAQAHRTSGTASGGKGSAIEPIGESSIALASAGTGTVLVGDIIVFDNHDTEYEITTGDTDISDGGTLVISPVLVAATAVGTFFSVKSDVINLVADAAGARVIAGSPAARDILASESGSTFLFDSAAGQSLTLPVGTVGLKYKFMTTVDLTAAAYAVLCNTDTAGDFLVGAVSGSVEAAATGEMHFANGTSHLGISSNKTTTGGLIGGWLEVECIAANLWSIKGVLSCTATPLTPFTT